MGHMDLTIFSQTKCMAKVTEKLTPREAPPDSLELSVNKATNHNEPPSQVYCTRNSECLGHGCR